MVEQIARTQPNELPLKAQALVKSLYLKQGLTPKEIEARQIGLTVGQIYSLVQRKGWTAQREEWRAKLVKTTEARVDEQVDEIADAIASEAEELALGTLQLVRSGISYGGLDGAKQAQAGSAALKNLVSVSQSIRKPGVAAVGDTKGATNFFFLGSPAAAVEPRAVEHVPVEQESSQPADFEF